MTIVASDRLRELWEEYDNLGYFVGAAYATEQQEARHGEVREEIQRLIVKEGENMLRRIIGAYRYPQADDPHRLDDEITGAENWLLRAAVNEGSSRPPEVSDPDMDVKCAKCIHPYGDHVPGGCSAIGPSCPCSGFLHPASFPPEVSDE